MTIIENEEDIIERKDKMKTKPIDKELKGNTYKANMFCRNCGINWIGEFSKGEKIPMYSVCPGCDCVESVFDSPLMRNLK